MFRAISFFSAVFVAFVASSLPVFAVFEDVPNAAPYSNEVNWMQNQAVVVGYNNGKEYRPGQLVTREEFLKMLFEIKEINWNYGIEDVDMKFSDVEPWSWSYEIVKKAYSAGIIDGYPDGTFGAKKNINLAEATKIVLNTFWGVEAVDSFAAQYDKPCNGYKISGDKYIDTGAWYWKYLSVANEFCLSNAVLDSLGSHGISPDTLINRGDMARLLYWAKVVYDNENKPFNSNFAIKDLGIEEGYLYTTFYKFILSVGSEDSAKFVYPDGSEKEMDDKTFKFIYGSWEDGWVPTSGVLENGYMYFSLSKKDGDEVHNKVLLYSQKDGGGDDVFYADFPLSEYGYKLDVPMEFSLVGTDISEKHNWLIMYGRLLSETIQVCDKYWLGNSLYYVDLNKDDPERVPRRYTVPQWKKDEAQATFNACTE